MTQVLKILSGLPASGKSTYATKWVADDPENRVRINWDDMRAANAAWIPGKFHRDLENLIQAQSFWEAENALRAGKSVIVDNTNLTEKAKNKWRRLGENFRVTIEEQEFDTPVETCVWRDAERNGHAHVGRAVIERMALFNGKIQFGKSERLLIVDVDGTLADLSHRRPFLERRKCSYCDGTGQYVEGNRCIQCSGNGLTKKDYDSFFRAVDKDTPIVPIINLVNELEAIGYVPIIVSGRPIDRAGKATTTWLYRYGIPYRHIFMRAGGDFRQDCIVKQEILDRLPKKQIRYVFDDRTQVVEMWRKNGLTCLQVADGNF